MGRPVVRLREGGVRGGDDETRPAALADAVVIEDDTYHVLGALPVASEEREAGGTLLKQAAETWPTAPGSVRVEAGEFTLRMLAVIYDLSQEPPCREEWVAQALDESLRAADRLKVRRLALPLLGARLGGLNVERFAEILATAIERIDFGCVSEIWLLTSGEALGEVTRLLHALGVELSTEDRS